MKGLLIKDLRLWMIQKNTLFVLIMLGLYMSISNKSIFSGTAYLCILAPIFTISTLSYDEFDNGMPFLMTMPINRKTYVREKYAFGLLSTCFIWVLSTTFTLAVNIGIRHAGFSIDIISGAIGTAVGALLTLAIMLPAIIKFGPEKYRFVLLAFIGIGSLLVFAAMQAAEFLRLDLHFLQACIQQASDHVVLTAIVTLCLAALGISYAASVKIMEKKEF